MLLPVEVESSRDRLPRATLWLVGVNAAIYLACVLQGIWQNGFSFAAIREPPDRVLSPWVVTPSHLLPWTFLTAPWIHLDFLHLAGNLLFLWVFGIAAEEAMGSRRVVAVYFAGGIASTMVQYLVASVGLAPADIGYAGSSGAVIAVITSLAIRRYRARVRFWLGLAEVSVPVGLALCSFLFWYGFLPWLEARPDQSPGYWGHLGGAVTGLMMALLLRLTSHGVMEYSLEDAIRRIERGELREGLEDLKRLERSSQGDSRVSVALARALVRVWDRPEAARHYARAIQVEIRARRLNAAHSIWDEATAAVEMPPHTAICLASAAADTGDRERAVQFFQLAASSEDEAAAAIARRRLAGMKKCE